MSQAIRRRDLIKLGLSASAICVAPGFGYGSETREKVKAKQPFPSTADSIIFIWLPGGIAQTDTWDPKKHTPFERGMRGNQLLGTCGSIPTAADGIFLGEGLENIASVMDRGTVVRTLRSDCSDTLHMKNQYMIMTAYVPPVGVKAPSIGSVVARTLGRRHPYVPPYIYIGRDINTSDEEKLFISEYIGPGFYGLDYAPFMIPNPTEGASTLSAASGMKMDRLDRRQEYLKELTRLTPGELSRADKVKNYIKVMENARAMMDSPVKKAFDWKEEKPETIQAYGPEISQGQLLNPSYYFGNRFGHGLLLARRLVEVGARFVQVEYQYGPFKGFDTHENGCKRMVEMKKQVDRPLAQLVRDLDERGLLERTLVVIATEFGRTIAAQAATGTGAVDADGFAEGHTGENLVIESERLYGFHGHFRSCSCMLVFGGGFKRGFAYGKTADRHPMIPVENPVGVSDLHATIYKALGIPADTNYVTEERPFYVTKDGKGQPIEALLT